jgi:hypothetical protein
LPQFGKSQGGGRRKSARSDAPLLVGLSTLTDDFRAAIVNLSHTGARFCGPELPNESEDLIIRANRVQAFGKVIWKQANECGVAFDSPLDDAIVAALREAANLPSGLGLSAEEQAALEDWQRGRSD